MESQFCLRWNNFSSSMTSALHKLHEVEDFVDVTIATEGVQMRAHKVILSACSPYLRNILKNNPCQHPVIILKEATVEDLTSVLTFMYEGEVNVTQLRLHTFMRLAEALQVRGLTDSHNAPETHSSNTKENDVKGSASLDLSTRKRRHSSSNRNNTFHKVHDVSTLKTTIRRSSQHLDSQSYQLPKPGDALLIPEQATKIRKSEIHLAGPRSSTKNSATDENIDIIVKETVAITMLNLMEVKREHPEGDCQEGKENGKMGVDASNGRGYHLRRSKPRSPSPKQHKAVEEEGLLVSVENNPPILTVPQRSSLDDKIPRLVHAEKQGNLQPEFPQDHACQNLPFPCPFCDKSYTSWGFRRRHIKGYHTGSPQLPCKWCFDVLPTHQEWENHVTSHHNLGLNDARNGLLILDEAHMVLQIAQPTRIDSLMEIIKNKKIKDKEEEVKEKANKT